MEKLKEIVVKLSNSKPNAPLSDTQNAILQQHLTNCLSNLHIAPDHPPYTWMIEKALQELDEEGGSCEDTISDFIKKEHKSLPWAHMTMLKHHLHKMTEKGELLMTDGGRFVLPGDSESVNPKRKRKRKCVKRKTRGNSEIKQKNSQQKEKEEEKQVQLDDVEVVREQKDLDEQQNDITIEGNCRQENRIHEEYWELNEHHNEPSTDKEDGQLSGQQNYVTGNKVFPRRVLRSTVHKQKGKEQLDATEGSLQLDATEGSLQLDATEGSLQLDATEGSLQSSVAMHQTSDRPSEEEAVAEDLLKAKKHHGWQKTNRPMTRAQAKGTVTPNVQHISGRDRTQVKLAMERSSEPKQPSTENSSETDRAQRQLNRWSKNPGAPKSVSSSKVEQLALCDSADQQLVLMEEPLSISKPSYASEDQHLVQMEEPLALATREEALNLTDPQHEVHLKQPKDKHLGRALKGKEDGANPDNTPLKDVESSKKLAKKQNDRGGGRRRNAQ